METDGVSTTAIVLAQDPEPKIPPIPDGWGSSRYAGNESDRIAAWLSGGWRSNTGYTCGPLSKMRQEQAEYVADLDQSRRVHHNYVMGTRRALVEKAKRAAKLAKAAALIRSLPRWPERYAMRQLCRMSVLDTLSWPRGTKAAFKLFTPSVAEQSVIDRLVAEMKGKQDARQSSKYESPEPLTPQQYAEKLRDHWLNKLDRLPDVWCQRQSFIYVMHPWQCALRYRRHVEWATSGWCKRHNKPSAVYDVLEVLVRPGCLPAISKDGKECSLGPWTYRRNRGHSLSARYSPFGDNRDMAAFGAEQNTGRRQAIVTAIGDRLESEIGASLIQADDYGRLYQTSCGTFVRVLCPSTGKAYWLGVPPSVTTAKAAVAATFGMREVEYSPEIQR